MPKNDKKRKTSEKPVSLSPLSFKEALLGLLRVKPKQGPEPNEEDQEEPAQDGNEEQEQTPCRH